MEYMFQHPSYEKKIYLNDGYLYNYKPTFVLYLPRIQSYPIWTINKYDDIVFNNNIEFIFQFYGKHDNNIVSNYNNFFKEISNILSIDKNYEINLFYYDEKEKLQSTDKIKIKNYSLNCDNPEKVNSEDGGLSHMFEKNIYLSIIPKTIQLKFNK